MQSVPQPFHQDHWSFCIAKCIEILIDSNTGLYGQATSAVKVFFFFS